MTPQVTAVPRPLVVSIWPKPYGLEKHLQTTFLTNGGGGQRLRAHGSDTDLGEEKPRAEPTEPNKMSPATTHVVFTR